MENFAKKATTWNKEHFGNVFAKKRRIMARLSGVQRAIANSPSSSLLQLENKLQLELDQVLDQEHELWALKSWINWTVQGDRNTSFFSFVHISQKEKKQNHSYKK